MADELMELYGQHRTVQDKYTYFLLAAAASALAFAVQKTLDRALDWSMLPLGVAALCWSLSFFFGCKNLTYVQTTLYDNTEYLQLKSGLHPRQPGDRLELSVAIDVVRGSLEKGARRVAAYSQWQFRTLIAGGCLFIGWHILEMYLRTAA